MMIFCLPETKTKLLKRDIPYFWLLYFSTEEFLIDLIFVIEESGYQLCKWGGGHLRI